jgi:hypothetical protein
MYNAGAAAGEKERGACTSEQKTAEHYFSMYIKERERKEKKESALRKNWERIF